MSDRATAKTARLLVQQVEYEADRVLSLSLVDSEGQDLPAWEPGAHIDLVLPSGLIRQYSLCGDPNDRTSYRIAVLREENGRGGSEEIHSTNLVGKFLGVRGPRNNFNLIPAKEYLFIAGGIGITPILPMLRQATATETPWRLVYGGQSRTSMAFLTEIAASQGGDIDVVVQQERGFPDLPSIVATASSSTAVYCCGPAGMLQAVEDNCRRYLPAGALYLERFSAAPPAVRAIAQKTDAPFEIELRRSGKVLEVPTDRTVLSVLQEAVPSMVSSCEEGYCGTCQTIVVDGVPDHRDSYLSEEERALGDCMMVCVSRAKTPRLVLDL
jgi:ferredoxin-NADP reductase